MRNENFLAVLCLLLLACGLCRAQALPAPLQYDLDLRDTEAHLVRVSMVVPQSPAGTEVQFPAWNNLYQIRDFIRDVQDLSARCDGSPEPLERLDLDTWASRKACSELVLHYEVYANQPGPFSAELNSQHAFLNFALLLFYLPKDRGRAVQLKFQLPEGWKLATLLDAGREPGEYLARDYDRLADSPAEAGHFAESDYKQSGADYRVIVDADSADYSGKGLIERLKKITASETSMMEDVPFKQYTFIFHFPRSRAGGGMEHAYGTAIFVPADQTRTTLAGVQAVAAHEFFHLWNVKRIRPQGLEPIDYVHGNDTRDLWFSEGVTSTYGELTLLRAGLIDRLEFYKHLSAAIQELRSRPARFYQSVETSGREAWLEKYPDYFRPDRSISYYNKGELLGDLLDIGIVQASRDRYSLDDLMRRLNQDYAKRGRYFTDADLLSIVGKLAPGFPAATFFRDDVDGTKSLDFAGYLAEAGLKLETKQVQVPALGLEALKSFAGPVRVESVDPQSAAARAGIQPGDVLVKLNGSYVVAQPEQMLEGLKPGDEVVVTVERGGRTLDITFPLGSKAVEQYEVDELKHVTPEQRAVRQGWLQGKTRDSAGAPN